MNKVAYFDTHWGNGWPSIGLLKKYFIAPEGQQWRFERRTGEGSLIVEGVDGTDHLPEGKGRVDAILRMWGMPGLGNFLMWTKWGGGNKLTYYSRGDLGRILENVRTPYDLPLPIGLFIPFEQAWPAVREFVETDGELPTAIAWVAEHELPPEAFPEP
jgi:hypothetical protein